MSHEQGEIDAKVLGDLEDANAMLDAHLAKVPQPGLPLFTAIDILRRTRRLVERADVPVSRRYAMIAGNIRGWFFGRRADGIRQLVLPEEVERKLFELSERTHALSVRP